jgi:predicted Zn-dependent protease with MMP-like domain
MQPAHRHIFDELLGQLIDELPQQLSELLEEVPLIVEDEPSPQLLDELEVNSGWTLCGLHWGTPLTHRSVEAPPHMPDRMMLFRGPIMRLAGFPSLRRKAQALDALRDQIRITLLHEIGHHFGLDEDDLATLGYG